MPRTFLSTRHRAAISKSFFKTRGLYLTEALPVTIGVLLLLGVALTLRHTLPRYVKQIQLFLNVGSVGEGERLSLDGLPWQVQVINFFSTLVNPDAKLTQRVPIEDLVDCMSRPASPDEPWVPCRKDDWVILGNGVRGKVVGIFPQLVLHGALKRGDSILRPIRTVAIRFRSIGPSHRELVRASAPGARGLPPPTGRSEPRVVTGFPPRWAGIPQCLGGSRWLPT
jgi:hypothetical protein